MIKVGIIGSGNWALALTKILTNVKIVVKARKLEGLKKKFDKNNKESLLIWDIDKDCNDKVVDFLSDILKFSQPAHFYNTMQIRNKSK